MVVARYPDVLRKKETEDRQAYLENRGIRASSVFQVWKAYLVPKASKGTLVLKVLEDPKVIEERWECQVFPVSMVYLECKDPLDLVVYQVWMVAMELMVYLVYLA